MALKNPYKQIPVARAEEPKPEWTPPTKPRLEKGDVCKCSLNPILYTIKEPCVILDIHPDKHYMSGWKVSVMSDNGIVEIDSGKFKKLP